MPAPPPGPLRVPRPLGIHSQPINAIHDETRLHSTFLAADRVYRGEEREGCRQTSISSSTVTTSSTPRCSASWSAFLIGTT